MSRIASISNEVHCYQWNDGSLHSIYRPPNSTSNTTVTSLSWAKDGGWLVIVPNNSCAEIVSFNDTVKLLHVIQDVQHPRCAAFQNATRRNIALGTTTGKLLIYDIKQKAIKKKFPYAPSALFSVQYTSKDTHVIAACENGEVFIYSNLNNTLAGSFKVPNSRTVTNFRCHPDKRNLIAASSEEGIVSVWDSHANKPLAYKDLHSAPVNDLCFCDYQTEFIASIAMDRRLCFYDHHNKKSFCDINLGRTPTAIDKKGVEIAIGTQDGQIVKYDIRNMKECLLKISAHNSKIFQVAFEKSLDQKVNESSFPEEVVKAESMESISSRTTARDSLGHMYCGDILPEIPEIIETEPISKTNMKDSFMDAMGLNSSIYHSHNSSVLSRPEIKSNFSAEASHESLATVETEEKSQTTRKSHVENFIRSQTVSTPVGLNLPDQLGPLVSPILQGTFKNINLSNDAMKKLVRDAVKEELQEFKEELKYQMLDMMAATRRQFLDLQMSIVREFISVEENLNKFREDVLTVDETYGICEEKVEMFKSNCNTDELNLL